MTFKERAEKLLAYPRCLPEGCTSVPETNNVRKYIDKLISEENYEILEQCEARRVELEAEDLARVPLQNRITEYSKIDTLLLEAIAEERLGRPEKMQQYLQLRQEIIDTNPLTKE